MGQLRTPYPLAWEPLPGQPLPSPRIADDREAFPVDVVKHTLAWLESLKPQFAYDFKPTNVTVTVGSTIDGRNPANPTRLQVLYEGAEHAKMQTVEWTARTFEMTLRSKHRQITASYHYLCAVAPDGRCIVGPELQVKQKQQIVLALGTASTN